MKPYVKTLSHVGVRTTDLERSIQWYTEVLGLDLAFRLERDGRTFIAYLQLTPTTFVELFAPFPAKPGATAFQPAAAGGNPKRPGTTHFAIEVTDIEEALADLLPRLPPESIKKREHIKGGDGALIFNFFDPDGNRIEYMQFPSESKQRQAMIRAGA
ncbi:MAG: VOC family protein [Candidatus Sumerlaeota bacterium]|nr:VOC family protein [Candidatus Sumerlaeota bacterium]